MDTLMVDKQGACTSLSFPRTPGLRFHGAPLRGEGLHLCREEMYHEPAQEDGCQLRGKPRHRAAVRTTARRNWVLTDDDMTVELHFVKGIQGLEVTDHQSTATISSQR